MACVFMNMGLAPIGECTLKSTTEPVGDPRYVLMLITDLNPFGETWTVMETAMLLLFSSRKQEDLTIEYTQTSIMEPAGKEQCV